MASNKKVWKPGTMLSPVPVVMLSCGKFDGQKNIITVAWAGTICSDPPMVSVSIRKSRFSHEIIKESGKFVINLVSENLVKATDWCGVKSGKDVNKFSEMNLTAEKAETSDLPIIKESPINIECTVTQVLELGSHDMFLAKVDSVSVAEDLIDEKTGAMDLKKAKLVAYSHGEYFSLGKKLGYYGYTVRKKK